MSDYTIDAKNKPLGRVASEIAVILQGKKKADYEPRLVGNDRVLLKNYHKVVVTGRKAQDKVYYRHTGYMGHLKSATYEEAFAKNPKEVVREAVRRMLPKNFLNSRRLKNLIFIEDNGS
ncbi:MAG: 50S ribosomal protein L13 [Anaplasmataceae bacterium]|nr:50S ribosomal protein L13 [Anaplasmataceae bacterium]